MLPRPRSISSLLSDAVTLRGIVDAVPHPVFVKDEDLRFVLMNESMCALMGHSFEDLVGKGDSDFASAEQAEVFRGNDLRVLSTGEMNENEELFTDGEGRFRTIVTQKKRLTLPDGRHLLVGCITDISDFRRAEALIRHNAEHDALTGLPNRRLFSERIRHAVARAARGLETSIILLIDLDSFKPVNDIHGHMAGDTVLCEIATRLGAVVREGDLAARLGGDEFAVISTHYATEGAAASLAARIIASLQHPIALGATTVQVGASIGISLCPTDGTESEALLRCADVAMYRAKQDGRGTFRLFEASMEADIRRRAALDIDFRHAVSAGDIRPYYQPLIELADNRLVGFEILARWDHPELGFVPPDTFIPIAEKQGVITELTLSLLRSACRDAKHWPSDLLLSLNLSPLQLKDSLIAVQLANVMTEGGLAPGRLEVGITEAALVADLPAARAALASFKNLGIAVALDDFGTGYSGMYHLRDLPIGKIKIDRTFVQSMRDNPQSAKIVSAILGLGKSLGLPITVEGIEDADMVLRMTEGGAEIGQGFYFGKAMPASKVAAMIQRLRDGGKPQRAARLR